MASYRTKRTLDIVLAAIGLVATSPLIALGAALILWRDGRPVFFQQTRTGMHEEPFQIVKLRTLRVGSEADESRRFRVGELLRRSSVDELPSLVNVLLGDMSLVGPRPLLEEYLRDYTPLQARRHEVRPGLTGLAQVSGRNTLSWAERFELDVTYIDSCSLKLDLQILARSVRALDPRVVYPADGKAQIKFAGCDDPSKQPKQLNETHRE